MADRKPITAYFGGDAAFLPIGGQMPGGMAQFCEDLPWGVAVLDSSLRYVHANEAFAGLTGRSVAAHIGRSLAEMGSSFAAEAEVMCRRVLASGEQRESSGLWGYPNASGAARWQASYFPLRNDYGVLCGVRIIVQDVTPRANLETALQRSREELNTELKFRTLISEMFGRLSNLLGDSVDDEISRALRHIRDFAGADHGSLLRFSEDGKDARITQSSPELGRNSWLPEIVSGEEFPWYVDVMRRGQLMPLPRLNDFPLNAVSEREHTRQPV